MKQKILLVYPHNFAHRRMGIDARFCNLAAYFKGADFQVDMLGLTGFSSTWDAPTPVDMGLVDNLSLYDFAAGKRTDIAYNLSRVGGLVRKLRRGRDLAYTNLPDYAFRGMKKKFRTLLEREDYDFVLIAYVYWANLLDAVPSHRTRWVLDLSDFITLNLFDAWGGKIDYPTLLGQEIRRVNRFDEVLCISGEEQWFFSQFATGPNYRYIPYFMKRSDPASTHSKEYDLLFIGSDNPFNREGIAWFFERVYPLLNPAPKVVVAGKISDHVAPLETVTTIPFVDDTTELYKRSRVALCPLLGGTGIKIKVVEALAAGLPVVTTPKGLTGLPGKTHNGCLTAHTPGDFAAHIAALLSDPGVYREHSGLAGEYFSRHFEESVVHGHLDEIFLEPQNRAERFGHIDGKARETGPAVEDRETG